MPEMDNTVTSALTLEHLRTIQSKLDRLPGDMQEVKERLGILEMRYASLSRRVGRIDERVERIDRRLELVEG